MSDRHEIHGLIFTCAACELPNRQPVTYKGKPDDKDAALAFVTGSYPGPTPKDPSKRKGPLCRNCLDQWTAKLKNDHFAHCAEAAGMLEEKLGGGKKGMVFTTHIWMTGAQIKGVWIASDNQWQEIPMDADDTRPRRDAWRKGKA